jgi:hypothetical protein
MEKIYKREIRHIVANYSIKNNATAYRIDSRSIVFGIIKDMIRRNWIEAKHIDRQFLFVGPSNTLKSRLKLIGTINKPVPVHTLELNLIWKNSNEVTSFKSKGIVVPIPVEY